MSYERSSVRTECIVDPDATPVLHVRLRCLQLQHRTVEAARHDGFEPVDVLEVDGVPWCAWDEAVEHDVEIADAQPVAHQPRPPGGTRPPPGRARCRGAALRHR